MPSDEGFGVRESPTAHLTLAQVVARLESSEDVLGVVALGSTADGLHEDSDIDLLVVLEDGPELGVEFEYIDGRPADVLLTSVETLSGLGAQEPTGRASDLARWLANGTILFSKHEAIDDAPAHAASCEQIADERQRYFRWVELNVNYVKLCRYASSARPDYQAALELLLDAAFAAAPTDALVLSGQPWPGERQAIAWLSDHMPEVLDLVAIGRRAPAGERFGIYSRLAPMIAQPCGGLWASMETTGTWILESHLKGRWRQLFRNRPESARPDLLTSPGGVE